MSAQTSQIATSTTSLTVDVVGPTSENRILPIAKSDHYSNTRSSEDGIAMKGSEEGQQQQHQQYSSSAQTTQEDYQHHQMRQISNDHDEGVEVVLENSGKSSVIDSHSRAHSHSRPSQDQNVFRAPHPVRPRAIRGADHRVNPGSVQLGSGTYSGSGQQHPHSALSHGGYLSRHHFQSVPYANNSGSFDQQDNSGSSYTHPGAPPTSQNTTYSPHVQYTNNPPTGGHPEDLNVISPNHKDHRAPAPHPSVAGPHHNRSGGPPHHPPLTPRSTTSRFPPQTGSSSSSYHHYPPSSPLGRATSSGISPPRVRGYAMRRPKGPYAAAQRSTEEASWGYPTPDRPRAPPVVAEASFDSEQQHSFSSQVSHTHSSPRPTTPSTPHNHRHHHAHGGPHHHGGRFVNTDPTPPHYGYSGSFEQHHGSSFDSSHHATTPYGPPSRHYDHDWSSYYGQHSPASSHHHHSEVSPYSYGYSPGGNSSNNSVYYDSYSPHAGHYGPPRAYEEHDRYHHQYPYHHNTAHHNEYHHHYHVKKDEKSGILLPKAASEVDFDISDPPLEPTTPASKQPVCESPADLNSYDVLCGRGGGTNSQVGNRRFRKLVQEFQPIYLLARRKEKPLIARTIVLIIRKRGGRFLKKDEETGELYEVGDSKAEAKTSQALREGLDVRATKSAAASSPTDNKKKKSSGAKSSAKEKDAAAGAGNNNAKIKAECVSSSSPRASPDPMPKKVESPSNEAVPKETEIHPEKAVVSPPGAGDACTKVVDSERSGSPIKNRTESPPTLPKLNDGKTTTAAAGSVSPKAPPSPEQMQFRKRRRMRSADGGSEPTTGTCGITNPFQGDKLFPDFCPPRADLARAGSPAPRLGGEHVPHMAMCGMARMSSKFDDDDIRYEEDSTTRGVNTRAGCAGIALDMMTGAAAGSFCLGPRVWSKRE